MADPRKRAVWLAVLALGTLPAPPAGAQPPAAEPGPGRPIKSLAALPISEPITLDCRLDEPAWAAAPVTRGFTQREPLTGEPASEETEVRIVYTPNALFVGVHALDSEPGELIYKEMKRDAQLFRDDSFIAVLDTFDDDRNAFMFETNPNGARTDGLITDEGRDFNLEWDGVWDVAACPTDDGWVAEIVIPFSTLRFDPAAERWGLNFRRYIRRRHEEVYWSPILLDANLRRVSLYGELTGIAGAEQGLGLNVKPFVVGDHRERAGESDDDEIDGGLDVKWGITKGMALDLTVNTDFGETEADATQINLTRFGLFFPEKREFFLENAGLFEFGPVPDEGDAPLLKVFHSRRIGIDPGGEEVPIDWGLRLTGRVGEWNYGVLDMQTADLIAPGGERFDSNNWGTARVKRNLGGRNTVGMIFTNRTDGTDNQVAGIDADIWPTTKLQINGYAARSDDSLVGDDWAGGVAATWNGSIWKGNLGFDRIGEDFRPDIGFLLRRGVEHYKARATYEPRPEGSSILNYHYQVEAELFTDLDGTTESELYTVDFFGLRTQGQTALTLFGTSTFERLFEPFEIVPGVVIPAGDYRFEAVGASGSTHSSKPVSVEAEVSAGDFFDGDRLRGVATLRLRPNRYLLSETTWDANDIDLPEGQFSTNVVRQRLEVNLTPRLLTSTFVQYNDIAEAMTVNFRFNWIYRPGADLFVVFNQSWDAPSASDLSTRDRQVIVKFTYLWQR